MTYIQNLYTSRDNNANGASYVGQLGRLWWNPDTNSLYYSDGSTPGGIAVGFGGNPFNQLLNTYNSVTFANINITGTANVTSLNVSGNVTFSNTSTVDLGNLTITDQTISGTISNRDVTIAAVGNANIEILGAFHVHTDGNSETQPQFWLKPDGQAQFLINELDNNRGAVEIVGTTSQQVVPLGNPGGMLHITGQNNQVSRFYNDGVSNYPVYIGRRFNGTAAAPTGVLSGQIISRLGANPYLTNTAGFASLGTAQINFIATEDQTTTAQGSRITMNVTPSGSNVQALVASFDTSGIVLTGNLVPFSDNIYSLGNVTNRWIGAYFGNAGIYVQDTTLGTTGQLYLDDGVFVMDDNITALQIGTANAIQLTTAGLITSVSSNDIVIGTVGDAGNTRIRNAGLKFNDGSVQSTAAIPLSYMGAANGVATLGSDSKVTPSQLPAGAVFFKGTWYASNNSPSLTNGVGTAGWEYQAVDNGTVNFGAGNITFTTGDFTIYNGTQWQRIPGSGAGVSSFNGRTGVVTLNSGDVTNALSNGSIVNSKLANSNVTINTGSGLSGGGTVDLGGSLTITANVNNILAGTGVTVTPSAGTYTIAIGQPVSVANSVQFSAITSTTTIQATGNITAGNLVTGGQVVATGNITTAGYLKTPSTLINNGIVSTANITGANLLTSGIVSATGNITGGNILTTRITATTASVTGNVTAGNLTVVGQSNLGGNANVHITGGTAGQSLITDGLGNLSWQTPQAGNVIIVNGTVTSNATIDFSYNSTTLIYLPAGPTVNLTLQNYTAGKQARVMVRFGTNYPINTGIANAAQSTEGQTTIPVSGGGGHNSRANSTVQLLYTCFDNTAANCYVAATYF